MSRSVFHAFLISASALTLQLTLTRILSVLYWQHLVYAILTTSLLGFAASGTVLHLSKRLREMEETAFVQFCFFWFAATSLLCVVLCSWLAGEFFSLSVSFGALNVLRLALSYFASALPFFFFGLLILGLLKRAPDRAGAVYAGNLLGSGAGSLFYLLGISPLGALTLIQAGVFLPSVLAAIFPGPKRRALSPVAFAALVGLLILSGRVSLTPEKHKQFWILTSKPQVEFSAWNPISRVDVIRAPQGLQRHVLIDGDAQTPLVPPADHVMAGIQKRWARPAGPLETPIAGWDGVSLLAHLELPGRGQKEMVITLDTGGRSYSRRVSLPAGRVVPVFLSWSPEGTNRLSVDYGPYSIAGFEEFQLGSSASVRFSEGAVQEAWAWSRVLDRSELLSISPMNTGYERIIGAALHRAETGRDEDHVLVIGNGGGADSVAAVREGARRVTAVEVNPTSYRLTKEVYRDYLGGFFDRPNVHLVLEDGRSFVRRSRERFDRITLVGVDSFAAASSGAYVLAENFLYTSEALSDYWDHLSPDGTVQISRWHFPSAPRETFRIFTMAYEMLARHGVADPAAHLTVVVQRAADETKGCFATVLLSKRPLSSASVATLRNGMVGYSLDVLVHPHLGGRENAFQAFVTEAKAGRAEQFYRRYPFNVRPVTDDNPFFFQYGKFEHLFRPYSAGVEGFDSIMGRWPFFILILLFGQTLVGAALIVLPIRRTSTSLSGAGYFACLGIGFMFVEMYLIQKLVLVLGHPMYSLGVTIPALLMAAALGSFLSRKLDLGAGTCRAWLFGGIALLLAVLTWVLPTVLQGTLELPFLPRAMVCIALIFPVGMALGIPFPAGLRSLDPSAIPLAWAINGSCSVFASVAAVIWAMRGGFSSLMWIAAALYAGAAWLVPSAIRERPEQPAFMASVVET